MTVKRRLLIPALLPVLLLVSCGSEQQASQQQSYKDIKSMVLDVLKTEEAEKAILSTAAKNQDKTIKLLATGEGQQIQLAVKELLTTEDHGLKMLQATMTDPKFAGDFAKAAQKNLKQIEKDLLKDPEYQKSMFEAFNNPDFQKIILETMKSQKYRQQMLEVVRESLQSPLFKAELINMFQKAVSEEMKYSSDKTLSITGEKGKGGGKEGGGQGDQKSGQGDQKSQGEGQGDKKEGQQDQKDGGGDKEGEQSQDGDQGKSGGDEESKDEENQK